MTFDPDCDLIWRFPFGQQGKFSSGVFAYIDKPNGTLCPQSAHTSKKLSLKTPVYLSGSTLLQNSMQVVMQAVV